GRQLHRARRAWRHRPRGDHERDVADAGRRDVAAGARRRLRTRARRRRRGDELSHAVRWLCEHTFVMRWDNLRLDRDGEEETRLPGYRDSAVVRRFDAPEAMDIRFYEVRAKSALNRVPKASQMPFRWTVNPYRGCTHACVFCASGDTPVLLADGRTRPLADLRVGEAIVGTVFDGKYRRCVASLRARERAALGPPLLPPRAR